MKERPILFSAEMVRAILEGRKTQTRRVINYRITNLMDLPRGEADVKAGYPFIEDVYGDSISVVKLCPYGKVGNQLWVKETHYLYGEWGRNGISRSGKQKWKFHALSRIVKYPDNPPENVRKNTDRLAGWYKRPSIFMPRWASRIQLEITNVRVERLQRITPDDAAAEGIQLSEREEKSANGASKYVPKCRLLWDSINGKKHPWASNPWVWVLEFSAARMNNGGLNCSGIMVCENCHQIVNEILTCQYCQRNMCYQCCIGDRDSDAICGDYPIECCACYREWEDGDEHEFDTRIQKLNGGRNCSGWSCG